MTVLLIQTCYFGYCLKQRLDSVVMLHNNKMLLQNLLTFTLEAFTVSALPLILLHKLAFRTLGYVVQTSLTLPRS